MASHGAAVVIGYLKNEARAREVMKTVTDTGGRAAAVQADLSRPNEVTRLFDEAEQAVGTLDIVVANAADIIVKRLSDCTEEDYDRIFDANTKSVFFTLKEAARRLRDGGRIIVSSTGGTRMFFPGQSLYLGSKGAVEQFVRALSWELGERGITVNAISPGFIDSGSAPAAELDAMRPRIPAGYVGTVDDAVAAARFLLSDEARYINGSNLHLSGGWGI
jgi:3-oxoacyl-[acyl-carrier protein] reductase